MLPRAEAVARSAPRLWSRATSQACSAPQTTVAQRQDAHSARQQGRTEVTGKGVPVEQHHGTHAAGAAPLEVRRGIRRRLHHGHRPSGHEVPDPRDLEAPGQDRVDASEAQLVDEPEDAHDVAGADAGDGIGSHRHPFRHALSMSSHGFAGIGGSGASLYTRRGSAAVLEAISMKRGVVSVSILEGSSVLVTGGTGSFGKAFIQGPRQPRPQRVVIFSRDELKQYEVRQLFNDDPRLRWFIGDVRDLHRLNRAMHGVDYVVHAAALKQVDTAEYNPFEFVKTNILGSQNVIEAAIDAGVKKVVALSTDKASSPINLYGATKLTADKLFITGNHYAAAYPTRFAVVRYGNVMGSRGSVIPLFRELARRASRCRSPTCGDPVLHHPAPGRAVRGGLLRDDAGRRAVRAAHPVDEDHRPGPGGRARRGDARGRPAPRREAARGDDLPGGGPPRVCVMDGRYYVLQPDLATWGYKPPPTASRWPTASTTPPTPTTSGTPSRRSPRSSDTDV